MKIRLVFRDIECFEDFIVKMDGVINFGDFNSWKNYCNIDEIGFNEGGVCDL